MDRPARLFVTVGTDHHRFDRLADWIEGWALDVPDVEVVYQEGASRAPRGAHALGIVGRSVLLEHMDRATVVVCQAGPGSVADANGRGIIPIVVPRRARYGEVVDDHQETFARLMDDAGRVRVATTEAELHVLLDRAFVHPQSLRTSRRISPAAAAVTALEEVAADVRSRRPGLVRLRRRRPRRR